MGLTEHTGHGVPTIIKKYGKEVFEITDNYIKCRIPYDEKVLDMSKKNVGINVGINITEKAVLGILISDPKKTAEEMAVEVGVTKRTIKRALVYLKKKGLIERIGSNKRVLFAGLYHYFRQTLLPNAESFSQTVYVDGKTSQTSINTGLARFFMIPTYLVYHRLNISRNGFSKRLETVNGRSGRLMSSTFSRPLRSNSIFLI